MTMGDEIGLWCKSLRDGMGSIILTRDNGLDTVITNVHSRCQTGRH